ncbi:hypothetical protein O6H91_05G041400 [Diphasiastrum complanatum]|uniref:Uncharacterized protein n=1 Tax=Diphasiastrum complanatum TaxID=34168 RepID=A0ACC2DML8_DIPCM|nr:hypothetical protein O6H91_Y008300 [Diphasiastrum complanatum]KAJ7555496.1 hypothetical protein O6H91_05G041400 [Diphasiastrum complanatum]
MHLRTCTVAAIFVLRLVMGQAKAQLEQNVYMDKCPEAEAIIKRVVRSAVMRNRGLAAGLLRMHFHDCFVNGCDASVLLDSTSTNQAEKDSIVNNPSLHGFEMIDEAKAALEAKCPGEVSCADILAFAARDGVEMLGGEPWQVRWGRRDGTISRAADVIANIPAPFFNLQQLKRNFAAKGFTPDEMITLSGAHTIGQSHCAAFSNRLYNFSSTSSQDPTLDPRYAKELKARCPQNNANPATVVLMDPLTPDCFDSAYFIDVKRRQGLFTSDASLLTDTASAAIVYTNAEEEDDWLSKFAEAMVKMSEIEVKTAPQGQIRKNCHVVNH